MCDVARSPASVRLRVSMGWVAGCIAACLLAGCADIHGAPASLTAHSGEQKPAQVTMADNVHIKLSTGYDRTLRRGTVWLNVGSVAAGDVYQPRDTVFSVEGVNVHEAYLVLSGGQLVGYFLPAENSFVSQTPAIPVPLQ